MKITVAVPLVAPQVGCVTLETETTEKTVTIRIGDASATIDRDAFHDVVHRLYGSNPQAVMAAGFPRPFGGIG